MKTKYLFLALIFTSIFNYGQETSTAYKEYSYHEFFTMIGEEKDSIFRLSNALIKYDAETDDIYSEKRDDNFDLMPSIRKDTLIITKELQLNNVQFFRYGNFDNKIALGFFDIVFTKKVSLKSTIDVHFERCVFNDMLEIKGENEIKSIIDHLEPLYKNTFKGQIGIIIAHSEFKNGIDIEINPYDINNEILYGVIAISDCKFSNKTKESITRLWSRSLWYFGIRNSIFYDNNVLIDGLNNNSLYVVDNLFYETASLRFSNKSGSELYINNNEFKKNVLLNFDEATSDTKIDWQQWQNKVYDRFAIQNYVRTTYGSSEQWDLFFQDSIINTYRTEYVLKNEDAFKEEIKLRAKFNELYKKQFDTKNSNLTYIEIKDLETDRTGYIFNNNPTFDNFFTFKINQFLKVFSVYGTKPSRAVIFSMYVILLFAFIYLLFPNSWDSHGKKRLMHRFEFFQKYLRRDDGMHTIYLEGKQIEISSYQEFKDNLEAAKLELPSFFITWSKPLYNASMFSSRIMTKFLKTTDVLSGKWKDLTPKQKRWKNIQIGFLLTLGLFYDLLIKMLNALMLSINTFTTLGFGEIPIKGLPRYLAIIQGFIGWFMLTIFSVSLISQLLN